MSDQVPKVPSELLLLLSDPLMGPAITRFVSDVRDYIRGQGRLTAAKTSAKWGVDPDSGELERAKIHGPDVRTIDALESALKRVAAAEADFIQAHKNCIAARDRVTELESAAVKLSEPPKMNKSDGPEA